MVRAGAARVNITPRAGVWMPGFMRIGTPDMDEDTAARNYVPRTSLSVGTHDPLYARALVLDDGQSRLGLVAIDTLWITHRLTQRIREWARENLAIPPEALVLNCSHTHSGAEWTEIGQDSLQSEVPLDVAALVVSGIQTALAQACASLLPCQLASGTGRMELVQVNRRHRDGPIDPDLPVLRVESEHGKPLALAVCFACHPTVLYSDCVEYSADYPGEVSRVLEDAYPDAVVLFLQGAAGNIGPRSFPFENREFISDAHVRAVAAGQPSPRTYAHSARIGRIVAGEALRVSETLATQDRAQLAAASSQLALPMKTRQEVAWYCRFFTVAPAWEARLLSLTEYPAEVQLLRIGNFRIVCLPGEPFVEYALDLRRDLGPETWVLGFCNDYPGYVCTEGAYQETNRYENRATVLAPGTHGVLRKTVLDLARKL